MQSRVLDGDAGLGQLLPPHREPDTPARLLAAVLDGVARISCVTRRISSTPWTAPQSLSQFLILSRAHVSWE